MWRGQWLDSDLRRNIGGVGMTKDTELKKEWRLRADQSAFKSVLI